MDLLDVQIPDKIFAPFLFLEGQKYLSETEDLMQKICFKYKIKHKVLTDLYEHPEKIKMIDEFKPKSIVMGTTGVYHEKLKSILDVFATCKHLPDNIFLTMGEEVLCGVIRKHKKVKPSIKTYAVAPMSKYDDENFTRAWELDWM